MNETKFSPDTLFEVSWEVCNKIGGIHTVIATKAKTAGEKFGAHYIVIGPDFSSESTSSEFEEDVNLLKQWRQSLYESGVRVRIGRWKIEGSPIAILADFTSLFAQKVEFL